jgi:DNA invertase Pin-like site-specific DNA recombinase
MDGMTFGTVDATPPDVAKPLSTFAEFRRVLINEHMTSGLIAATVRGNGYAKRQ